MSDAEEFSLRNTRQEKTACFHKLLSMVTSEGLRKVSKILYLNNAVKLRNPTGKKVVFLMAS